MVGLLDRIDALIHQETTFYATPDYMCPSYQLRLGAPAPEKSLLVSSSSSRGSSSINEKWRETILEWVYSVVDHFDFSRDVASVTASYLDRFLSTRQVNKQQFQLVSMTCLFIAIKLYEPGQLQMSSMIELSRGVFTVEQMRATELEILRNLSFLVHPPTPFCFVKHMLVLVPYESISVGAKQNILELARFMVELSVLDYYFVTRRPSSLALAALIHAMQEIPGTEAAERDLARQMERIPGIEMRSPEVLECLERISQLYAATGYSRQAPITETREEAISPVCVSYGFPTAQQQLLIDTPKAYTTPLPDDPLHDSPHAATDHSS